jgi:multiple sugar transport system permease protein
VTMIPIFILLKKLNWIDTYKALILPGMFSAYGTFMLRQFFLTVPKDLEDAAVIDGCGKLRIWWNMIIPLSKAALATLTTFTFMGCWNEFMWPLIVTNSLSMKTLPVGLASFQGLYSTNWTLLMAASLIVLFPVLIVYLFNQRFFTEGIVLSGLKA